MDCKKLSVQQSLRYCQNEFTCYMRSLCDDSEFSDCEMSIGSSEYSKSLPDSEVISCGEETSLPYLKQYELCEGTSDHFVIDLSNEYFDPFFKCSGSVEHSDEDTCQEDSGDGNSDDYSDDYSQSTDDIETDSCNSVSSDSSHEHPEPVVESDTKEPIFKILPRIHIDKTLGRTVADLSLDYLDKDPLVLAGLIDNELKVDADVVDTVNYLRFGDLVTPTLPVHNIECPAFARTCTLVPKSIPVNRLNKLQTGVLNELEAQFSSGLQYPNNDVVSKELENFTENFKTRESSKQFNFIEHYNYKIEVMPSRRTTETYFQLRGSNVPKWFPGMYTFLPDDTQIRLGRSPSEIIHNGWDAL